MDFLPHIIAAGGDKDGLEFWFWLIVAAVFFIKKAFDFFKSKPEDETGSPVEREDQHEKRVREVIEEMRRGRTDAAPAPNHHPTTPPPMPHREAAPASLKELMPGRRHAPPSTVELPTPSVAHRPKAAPTKPGTVWTNSPAQAAAQTVMDRYVKATEEAQHSINTLSDAEQAALQRLQHRQQEQPHPARPTLQATEPMSLKETLHRSQSLRTAILYQEILGRPKSLQQ